MDKKHLRLGARFAIHKGDVQAPVPKGRSRSASTPPLTPVGTEVQALRKQWGMTYKDIASALSRHTGLVIAQTTVYSWCYECRPRRLPESQVLLVIKKIKAEAKPPKGGAWKDPETVRKVIREILSQVEISALSETVSIPERTMRSWRSGRHRVATRKWDKVMAAAIKLGYIPSTDS